MSEQRDGSAVIAGVIVGDLVRTGRAKTLGVPRLPPRRTGGDALQSAMTATGKRPADIARALHDVDPKVVSRILSGDVPLTHERMRELPLATRRAYLDAERALCDEESPASGASFGVQTLRLSTAVGELAAIVVAAEADRFVDEDELRSITRAGGKVIELASGVTLSAKAGGTK